MTPWINPSIVALWIAYAGIFALTLATNPWHGQFLTPEPGPRAEHGWIWAAHAVWSLSLIGAITILYVRFRRRVESRTSRVRIDLMLVTIAVNLVAYPVYLALDAPRARR